MNALVRTVLLVIIALFLVINLLQQVGERIGPFEKMVLAVPAMLLVWAAFRLRRRAS
jgi:glucose-6-phosphate-specific signal transduction histidine kinase